MLEHLFFPQEVAVYWENGDYIVHNVKVSSWGLFNQEELNIYQTLRNHETVAQAAKRLTSAPETISRVVLRALFNRLAFTNKDDERDSVTQSEEVLRSKPDVPTPSAAYLVMTLRCNLSCTYCYAESGPHISVQGDLTMEEYKSVLQQVKELGVRTVIFTGGEPFTRSDMVELISYAKSLGLRTNAISNGRIINKALVERLIGILDKVTISIDSMGPEVHDHNRGKFSHHYAMRALQYFMETPITVNVNSTLTNVIETDDYLTLNTFLRNKGVKHKTLFLTEIGRGDVDVQGIPLERQMEIQQGILDNETALANNSPVGTDAILLPLTIRNHCGAGTAEFSIDPKGNVFPCKLLHDSKFLAGNLRESPLKDIWEFAPTLRELRGTTMETLPNCLPCSFRFICGGSCRASVYGRTNDLHATLTEECPSLRRQLRHNLWASARSSLAPTPMLESREDLC